MCSRYFDRFRDEVVIHEIAHYVDFKRHGSRKNSRGQFIHHDDVFRGIMLELGSDKTDTTHDFEVVKTRVMRKWNYYCDCVLDDDVSVKGCTTSTVIHNRIQKKGQTRVCHGCGYHFSKKDFRHEVMGRTPYYDTADTLVGSYGI